MKQQRTSSPPSTNGILPAELGLGPWHGMERNSLERCTVQISMGAAIYSLLPHSAAALSFIPSEHANRAH